MKTIYTCFCTDVIHEGHLHIIEEAHKYGAVIVGALSDRALIRCMRFPTIPFEERVRLYEGLDGVDRVVVQDDMLYDDILAELKPDYVIHGDNWRTGPEAVLRESAIRALAQYGGELIELYHSYAIQPTKELLDILLLHNREDLEGMITLYRVMAIPLFFEEQGFSPVTLSLEHTEDAFGKARTNAVFTLQTDIPLPVSLSLHGSGTVLKNCFLAGRERTVLLRLPVYDGVLKHFYPDYKNYSYLPAEDTAIHKSVAVYVDKSQRMPATAATCYTKKEGQFLPCFSVPDELPLFRENHKDRQCFLLADDLLNSDASVQKEYLSGLLRALVKTKK